jgi:hypothetical protein
MRWLFAVALVLGMVALIAWAMVQGGRGPGVRQSESVRRSIAASIAFGMGGLSAAYAGWNLWLATVGAVAAAAAAAWYAGRAGGSSGEGRG